MLTTRSRTAGNHGTVVHVRRSQDKMKKSAMYLVASQTMASTTLPPPLPRSQQVHYYNLLHCRHVSCHKTPDYVLPSTGFTP